MHHRVAFAITQKFLPFRMSKAIVKYLKQTSVGGRGGGEVHVR